MDWYIHPSHEGYGDQENLPHVHICFGGKNDRSTQVSVSLITCEAIVSGRDITYRQQKEATEYVKNHKSEMLAEWDRKSGNHW